MSSRITASTITASGITAARFTVAKVAATLVASLAFLQPLSDRLFAQISVDPLGFYPHGISHDGRKVVGQRVSVSGSSEAIVWSRESGEVGLGDLPGGESWSSAHAISGDGLVVVGEAASVDGREAFRWTLADGMESIGELPGGLYGATATAVSADGSVIAGGSFSADSLHTQFQGPHTEAFRWTRETGMVALGFIEEGWDAPESGVRDMTPDGRVLVGYSSSRRNSVGRFVEAFRWTPESEMQPVSDYEDNAYANAISDDGAVVVGQAWCSETRNGNAPFRWTDALGLEAPRCGVREELIDLSGNGRVALGRNGSLRLDGSDAIAFGEVLQAGGFNTDGWVFFDARAISGNGLSVVIHSRNSEGVMSAIVVTFPDANRNEVPDALERAVDGPLDEDAPRFLRGDADGDGVHSLTDAIRILASLYFGRSSSCWKANDVNDDGGVNVTDPIYLLQSLFTSGPAVPAPSESCGADRSPDELSCVDGCR